MLVVKRRGLNERERLVDGCRQRRTGGVLVLVGLVVAGALFSAQVFDSRDAPETSQHVKLPSPDQASPAPSTPPETETSLVDSSVGTNPTAVEPHGAPDPTSAGTALPARKWSKPTNSPPCAQRNTPLMQPSFWAKQPGFAALKDHSIAVNKAFEHFARDRAAPSFLRFVDAVAAAKRAVRPNPFHTNAAEAPSSDADPLGLSYGGIEVRECLRLAGADAIVRRAHIGGASAAVPASSCPDFIQAVAMFHAEAEAQFIAGVANTTATAPGERLKTKPTLFVDLGAREYVRAPVKAFSEAKWIATARRLNVPDWHLNATVHTSSFRFFEAAYPGFADLEAHAFELDEATYAKDYAPVQAAFEARGRSFGFFPVAAWTHEKGVKVQRSGMMGIQAECKKSCICLPTMDFAQHLLAHTAANHTAVVKMDIEGAEFPLLEHLIRTGAVYRLAEVFLECHSTTLNGLFTSKKVLPGASDPRSMIFDRPAPGVFGTGRDTMFLRHAFQKVTDVGIDCMLVHDTLRGFGVVTHLWP